MADAAIRWGVCTTVRAPVEQVLAVVAHHLSIGAAHVWVHFDDPEDPAFERLARIPDVTPIRCDARWWGRIRPERHQNRQSRNILRLYRQAPLPWIAHLDVDEFIVGNVGRALATDADMVRIRPWEALHDPALPDDIFTARHFRAAAVKARRLAFGQHADLFPSGMVSHQHGKAIFRTGRGLEPRIHGAFRDGQRVEGIEFSESLALLHFHAEDPARWADRLQFRLTRGAYAGNAALRDHLLSLDESGILAFHAETHMPPPERMAELLRLGLMQETDLTLRRKVEELCERQTI